MDILKDMDNGAKNIAAKSGHGVGKSALISFAAWHFLVTRPQCVITATAPSANQLSDVLWPEMQRWMNTMMQNPLGRVIAGQYKWTSENIYHKDYPDTWFASARTASKENPQALAGRHSKRNMNLIDEASDVDDKAIEIMEANYGTEETITILMGNPVRVGGAFYRLFNEKNPTYLTKTISCLESSIASLAYIEKIQKRYGEDSDIYKTRVLGEFPETSTNSWISYSAVRSCVRKFTVADQLGNPIKTVGVDVGYTGDPSILAFRNGNCFEKWKEFKNIEPIPLAEQTAPIIIRYKPRFVFVDVNGIGLGYAGRLKQLVAGHGIEVIYVNVSENATDGLMYHRLRDELWGRLKEQIRLGTVSFWDNEDEDLCGEISAPHYKAEGPIKIESKREMKARGLSSPNIADAHALTCYVPTETYDLTEMENNDKFFETKPEVFDTDTGY